MKGSKTAFWVLGGIVATAASAYAVHRLRIWMAWQDEKEYEETKREIDRYEEYVHSNGDRKPKAKRPKKTTVA
jgi:hypothetical protein